jgi:hypothetical protein
LIRAPFPATPYFAQTPQALRRDIQGVLDEGKDV